MYIPSFLVILFLFLSNITSASEENGIAIVAKKGDTLRNVLIKLSHKKQVVFSLELLSNDVKLLDKQLLSDDSDLDLQKLKEVLGDINLKTSQYKNAILIRSSQLANMSEREDILGTKVKDFHFEGDYDSLVKKLSSLFPELPPDILSFSGSGAGGGNHYKIDIPGNSSIRDILMHLSSNYRLPWCLEIQEITPTYTIKQSTGDIKAKGSNMILKLGFF